MLWTRNSSRLAQEIMACPTNYTRRTDVDVSQKLRHTAQGLFLLLNLWIGVQFYRFILQFEPGGTIVEGLKRPAGVDGWLPIAGLMKTRYLMLTGTAPDTHPAAMVLFIVFVLMSLLLRKSFCGWLCPIGTISERLWKLGVETFKRTFVLPRWIDIPLRSLKYLLLGFFAWAIFGMTAASIDAFGRSPYGLIADVKLLEFFRHPSQVAAGVMAFLIFASVFVQNFWCRYLCPYGALLGLAAMASPMRITRNKEACIDCAKCAKACPSQLPVDRLVQIRSAECLGCMECVAICPAEGALAMQLAPVRRSVRPQVVAAGIAALFIGGVLIARGLGVWEGSIPDRVYEELAPMVSDVGHPR